MKIALISRSVEIHSTRRLLEAGRARGHEMMLVPILESRLSMGEGHVLRVRGQPLSPVEAVIPRIGAFMPDLGLSLLRFFERQGVRTLNGSQAIAHSRDKYETRATLLDLGLPVPRTIYVKDLDQISSSLDELGVDQVVLKPREGTQGRGVILAESRSSAASILESLLYLNREVLLEEYFAETRGCDLRLLVLGSEVVAAARRRAAEGDFRSNLHQGGQLEPIEVDPDVGELARRATRGLGLEVAGVDILETHRGPVLLEVNAGRFENPYAFTAIDDSLPVYQDLTGTGFWAKQQNCGDPDLLNANDILFVVGCSGGNFVGGFDDPSRDELRGSLSRFSGEHELKTGINYRTLDFRERIRRPAPFSGPLVDGNGVVVEPDGVISGSFHLFPDSFYLLEAIP